MYYIGLDVHKKTISYCVKEASGHNLEGDVADPRGGIRWVVAENASYWKK